MELNNKQITTGEEFTKRHDIQHVLQSQQTTKTLKILIKNLINRARKETKEIWRMKVDKNSTSCESKTFCGQHAPGIKHLKSRTNLRKEKEF